jgi:hypothetical protein
MSHTADINVPARTASMLFISSPGADESDGLVFTGNMPSGQRPVKSPPRPASHRLAAIVDDAVLVWVVHDTNPHALSPKVKKLVQAQHWFQDLTTIGLE